ncbi:Calcium-dependent secretion activator [Folsomia candida]|uniref:Calcium-dependent secretion activator n=1 Tax=Folsomia candida TaxID=158441 RepID=A0A226DBG7_FOLCA|nr:Calcium-dependent secretion activator [Folsomia candida]
MAKFDCILKGDEDTKRTRLQPSMQTELILLSKEQLYDMFQQILGVKKFEHQLLFNALQRQIVLSKSTNFVRVFGFVSPGGPDLSFLWPNWNDGDSQLSKMDVVLPFTLEVKQTNCARIRREHPSRLKVKLLTENPGMLALEDKELGKVVYDPLHLLQRYLYALGKGVWKKWKNRYFILVQVSQYAFAMCSYKEKKSEPTEMLQLDGYTVDYIEPASDLEGGRYFFNAVKEGDSVLYACDDENESHLWVMAMYRATGQAHKPAPPLTPAAKNSTISKLQGDVDRARKHGMEEYISADPSKYDHHNLFKCVQTLTLDFRLADPYCPLVRTRDP